MPQPLTWHSSGWGPARATAGTMAAAAAEAVFQTEFGRAVTDCVHDGRLTPPDIEGCQAKLDAVCGLLLVNGPCGGWGGLRLKSVCCDGQRGVQLQPLELDALP